MPVHIDELTSEVRAAAKDIQLSDDQVEGLITRVLSALREQELDLRAVQDMSAVAVQARPPVRVRK